MACQGLVRVACFGVALGRLGMPDASAAQATPSWSVPQPLAGVVVSEADIRRDRPRILLTRENVPEIRKRLARGLPGVSPKRYLAWKEQMEKQWDAPFQPPRDGECLATHAFIYALGEVEGVAYAGEAKGLKHRSVEESGRKGVEFLKLAAAHWDQSSAEAGYGTFALLPVCWAYDWLHPLLGAEERKTLVGQLLSAVHNQKRRAQRMTFKDYSLAGHNYVVALAVAREGLEIDHTAPWDPARRFQGNSDRYARELLDDLNGIFLNRFYAGWKFARGIFEVAGTRGVSWQYFNIHGNEPYQVLGFLMLDTGGLPKVTPVCHAGYRSPLWAVQRELTLKAGTVFELPLLLISVPSSDPKGDKPKVPDLAGIIERLEAGLLAAMRGT